MTITVNLDFGKREFENSEECLRTIHRTVLQVGCEITAKVLEAVDEQLLDSRDVSRFRCKGFQQTCIKTMMGAVEFKRRVYLDNAAVEGSHCVHLPAEAEGSVEGYAAHVRSQQSARTRGAWLRLLPCLLLVSRCWHLVE